MRRAFITAAALAVLAASVEAADWPQWRGPNRDGVAPDSPPLVESFPKEGPKKVWESEPIPGGDAGGFAQPTVAEGKAFVFYNCRFDKPLEVRELKRNELAAMGWMPDIPEDLAKEIEKARTSEDRAKLKDGKEINAFADAWIKDHMTPEQRKFQGVARTRIVLGAAAVPLDVLAKLDPVADKPFASQGELDHWIKERGIDPDSFKKILAHIPTTVRACNDVVFCLDRQTGKTAWKQELTGNWMWYAASSTPTVQAGKCYFLGSGAVAYALNTADGSIAWQSKPLAGPNSHNRSSSALLYDGKLVFSIESQLTALDAKTGEPAWTNRTLGDEVASPVAWTAGGKTLLLTTAGGKLTAVDPADGKTAWTAPAGATGSTPVVSGDIAVFCTSGKETGLMAFRLKPDGAQKLWNVPLVEWSSSVVISGKYVWAIGGGSGIQGFGEANKGRAVCVELETGKVAWDETLGPAQLSSPILADGKLLAEIGAKLFVIKAAPEKYELLGKADLGLASWTSPAFSDGFLFVRTGKNVACYDLRK